MLTQQRLFTLVRHTLLLLLFGSLFFFRPEVCSAQQSYDTWGTNFQFTFLPNYHQNGFLLYRDSLYVFVYSKDKSDFSIRYFSRLFTNNEERYWEVTKFGTATIDEPWSIAIPWREPDPDTTESQEFDLVNELEGFETVAMNQGVGGSWRRQNGQVARQSFTIESNADVQVYIFSKSYFSSDATMVLPTDVLGTEYEVLTYPSDPANDDNIGTPSQFAVVATENETNVRIDLSTPAHDEELQEITVQLQDGEVYLVQSPKLNLNNSDLSGSVITADKPVAVFAGHQRARIPTENVSARTRDFLVHQCTPTNRLGFLHFLTPFPRPDGVTNRSLDKFRVMATQNETTVTVSDGTSIRLDRGEVYEGPLVEALKLMANKRVAVATFKKTSRDIGDATGEGDPFMMFIPPVEQFERSYQIANIEVFQNDFGLPLSVFTAHYISVVIPKVAIPSLRLDNQVVAENQFTDIPDSEFSYAVLPVAGGIHHLTSDTIFGVSSFGYGEADSYGYVGLVRFRDIPPPIFDQSDESVCFESEGYIVDPGTLDISTSYVGAEVVAEATTNVDVAIEEITGKLDSIAYSASLQNPFKDGQFNVIVENVFGYRHEASHHIHGFDVHVEPQFELLEVQDRYVDVWADESYEIDITVTNYSDGDNTITGAFLAQQQPGLRVLTIGTPFPVVLRPQESITIPVEVFVDKGGEILDTLYIRNDCIERPLVAFQIDARKDVNAPTVSSANDSCRSEFEYVFIDKGELERGIDSWDILESENCVITPVLSELPDELRMVVQRQIPGMPMWFTYSVVDVSGNRTVVTDTIGPTLLEILAPDGGVVSVATLTHNLLCASIEMHNGSEFWMDVTGASLKEFTKFGVPISQFPIAIPPQGVEHLQFCFRSTEPGTFYDTLHIFENCFGADIILAGTAEPFSGSGSSRCSFVLEGSEVATQSMVVEPAYPNPVSGIIRSTISIPAASTITVSLVTLTGELVRSDILEMKSKGSYGLHFPIDNVPAGMYILVVKNGIEVSQQSVTVVR